MPHCLHTPVRLNRSRVVPNVPDVEAEPRCSPAVRARDRVANLVVEGNRASASYGADARV
jgi:hypothetical protein